MKRLKQFFGLGIVFFASSFSAQAYDTKEAFEPGLSNAEAHADGSFGESQGIGNEMVIGYGASRYFNPALVMGWGTDFDTQGVGFGLESLATIYSGEVDFDLIPFAQSSFVEGTTTISLGLAGEISRTFNRFTPYFQAGLSYDSDRFVRSGMGEFALGTAYIVSPTFEPFAQAGWQPKAEFEEEAQALGLGLNIHIHNAEFLTHLEYQRTPAEELEQLNAHIGVIMTLDQNT